MLSPLFGSENAEKIFIFLLTREKGYPTEIAAFFDVNLFAVQKLAEKFEIAGILISEKIGRSRVYSFNPRYIFLPELKALVLRAYEFYPPEVKEELENNRRRPRRSGKPL
ncbi:MAG: ArsR family transcriptional regulator [Anaerolineaceae bacterium]